MLQLTIVLFMLGAVLLLVESFVPGFGFFGITGIILSVLSLVLTVLFVPGGTFIVLGEIALFGIALFAIYKHIKRTRSIGKLILTETLNSEVPEMSNYDCFLAREAVTITSLRPYGDADFNGNIMTVCSEGNYIPQNKKVKVVRVEGSKIVVERIGN